MLAAAATVSLEVGEIEDEKREPGVLGDRCYLLLFKTNQPTLIAA
jgi:hypothetical protein